MQIAYRRENSRLSTVNSQHLFYTVFRHTENNVHRVRRKIELQHYFETFDMLCRIP